VMQKTLRLSNISWSPCFCHLFYSPAKDITKKWKYLKVFIQVPNISMKAQIQSIPLNFRKRAKKGNLYLYPNRLIISVQNSPKHIRFENWNRKLSKYNIQKRKNNNIQKNTSQYTRKNSKK
jgi:hypothetical protein